MVRQAKSLLMLWLVKLALESPKILACPGPRPPFILEVREGIVSLGLPLIVETILSSSMRLVAGEGIVLEFEFCFVGILAVSDVSSTTDPVL